MNVFVAVMLTIVAFFSVFLTDIFGLVDYNDPHAYFTQEQTNSKYIKWVTVNDANAVCQEMLDDRSKLYYGCSKVELDVCTIYTDKETTTGILGHEAKNCLLN